jgi:hypothetical protein
MKSVHERYRVKSPYVYAREHLCTALQVAVNLYGLERRFKMTYGRSDDPLRFDEPWRVRWSPGNSESYESFDGEITVRPDINYRTAILELQGQFEPSPPGQSHDQFSAARRVARAGRALLRCIAHVMEHRHR